jgi:hypothetical protein
MSSRPSSDIALSITTMKDCSVKSYHIALLVVTKTSSVYSWMNSFIYLLFHQQQKLHLGQTKFPRATNSTDWLGSVTNYYPASTKPLRSTLTEDGAGCLLIAQHGDPMLYQRVGRDEHLRKLTRHDPTPPEKTAQAHRGTCPIDNERQRTNGGRVRSAPASVRRMWATSCS